MALEFNYFSFFIMFIFWPIFRWSSSHHKGLKAIQVFIQKHHWGVFFKVDGDNLEFLKMIIFWIIKLIPINTSLS
jgi:hypothetical protein